MKNRMTKDKIAVVKAINKLFNCKDILKIKDEGYVEYLVFSILGHTVLKYKGKTIFNAYVKEIIKQSKEVV